MRKDTVHSIISFPPCVAQRGIETLRDFSRLNVARERSKFSTFRQWRISQRKLTLSASGASKHLDCKLAYFHRAFSENLSPDERLIVAHKCSEVPRGENWHHRNADDTLGMMFDPSSPFAYDVGLVFPFVSFDNYSRRWRNMLPLGAVPRNENELRR